VLLLSLSLVHWQSTKKLNLWNSEPARAHSTLTIVALCIRTLSFILTLAASCHVNWSSSNMRLNECVFSTLGDFLQVDKWRILRSNAFVSNSVSNKEKLLWRLFRCYNRLKERIVWAVRNVTSGPSISNRAERPLKTAPNMDSLLRQWTTITLRMCLLWFVKIVA